MNHRRPASSFTIERPSYEAILKFAARVCARRSDRFSARADENEAKAVVDKAIKAMGGEGNLSRIKAFVAKGKGTVFFAGKEIPFTFELKSQGIGQYRSGYEGEVDGNKFDGLTVLDGDKGWKRLGEDTKKLEGDELANENAPHTSMSSR